MVLTSFQIENIKRQKATYSAMTEQCESLTLDEVADFLKVNYQLIYRLVRSGELPAVRIGRLYRVMRADLDAYIERSKTAGPFVCSVCGQSYGSANSVRNGCIECGAPICLDCWSRLKRRKCATHAGARPAAQGQGRGT